MREKPKRRARNTKTGNRGKQPQATVKHSINSTYKRFFDEQTVYDDFFIDLGRGANNPKKCTSMKGGIRKEETST